MSFQQPLSVLPLPDVRVELPGASAPGQQRASEGQGGADLPLRVQALPSIPLVLPAHLRFVRDWLQQEWGWEFWSRKPVMS